MMPAWRLRIWSEMLPRFGAERDLQILNLLTFPDWTGEMPQTAPRDEEGRQRQWAYQEGNEMRRRFRETLARIAAGLPVGGDDDDGVPTYEGDNYTTNKHGESVDRRTGAIVGRSAAHIKAILLRWATGEE